MSLDGFVAGPDQSVKNPLGIGGEGLHDWVVSLAAWRAPHGHPGGEVNESSAVVEESQAGLGATIMGRNMFGGHPGPWDPQNPWNGWWGEDPPFHHPVFVLTHHARDPLELEGGTTFTFVTDGIESALEKARRPRAGRTWRSPAARTSRSSTYALGSSTRWRSIWCQSSSGAASGSSKTPVPISTTSSSYGQ